MGWSCLLYLSGPQQLPFFITTLFLIFVDIDPSQIENKISERTKTILPVHIHRMPADMDAVLQIADQYNLKVIEDGAQLHGMD